MAVGACRTDTEGWPIHESVLRPVLFARVPQRVFVLELGVVASIPYFGGWHVGTVGLALFYLTVVHGVLAWATAQDPDAFEVYVRSLRYRDWYAPHAALGAKTPAVESSIPKIL